MRGYLSLDREVAGANGQAVMMRETLGVGTVVGLREVLTGATPLLTLTALSAVGGVWVGTHDMLALAADDPALQQYVSLCVIFLALITLCLWLQVYAALRGPQRHVCLPDARLWRRRHPRAARALHHQLLGADERQAAGRRRRLARGVRRGARPAHGNVDKIIIILINNNK